MREYTKLQILLPLIYNICRGFFSRIIVAIFLLISVRNYETKINFFHAKLCLPVLQWLLFSSFFAEDNLSYFCRYKWKFRNKCWCFFPYNLFLLPGGVCPSYEHIINWLYDHILELILWIYKRSAITISAWNYPGNQQVTGLWKFVVGIH